MPKFKYTHDTEWTLERGESSIGVLIEYAIEERGQEPSGLSGPPEHYDPGSGWVFCINPVAVGDDDTTVTLTDEEIGRIHDWLAENPPVDDGWDDW